MKKKGPHKSVGWEKGGKKFDGKGGSFVGFCQLSNDEDVKAHKDDTPLLYENERKIPDLLPPAEEQFDYVGLAEMTEHSAHLLIPDDKSDPTPGLPDLCFPNNPALNTLQKKWDSTKDPLPPTVVPLSVKWGWNPFTDTFQQESPRKQNTSLLEWP